MDIESIGRKLFTTQTVLLRKKPPGRRLMLPSDAVEWARATIGDQDRERFVVILLDVRHRVIGYEVAAIGSLTGVEVNPRDVFKTAILTNAAAVIFLHNHPSGDPEPSRQDVELTERLKQAGDLLGIAVLDHIVVGADGSYSSVH